MNLQPLIDSILSRREYTAMFNRLWWNWYRDLTEEMYA